MNTVRKEILFEHNIGDDIEDFEGVKTDLIIFKK